MKRRMFMIALLLLLAGCGEQGAKDKVNGFIADTNRGVGFVPSQDFKQSLADADASGSYIGFYTPMDASKDIPEIVKVAYEYKLDSMPIVNINFFNAATGQKIPGYSEEAYKKQIMNIVSKYKPEYIGVGNEINRYGNLEEFVRVYNEIYSSIKTASPETKVFTVFQYEGLDDIAVVDKFNADLIGITTYPFIKGYKISDTIPAGHYSKLSSIKKPIIFTEIGHNSLISEDDQANFVNVFYDRISKANINPEIVVWGLLYDVPSKGDVWNAGLFTKEGAKKKAFYKWTGKNGE